jgi:hypothetical protein
MSSLMYNGVVINQNNWLLIQCVSWRSSRCDKEIRNSSLSGDYTSNTTEKRNWWFEKCMNHIKCFIKSKFSQFCYEINKSTFRNYKPKTKYFAPKMS